MLLILHQEDLMWEILLLGINGFFCAFKHTDSYLTRQGNPPPCSNVSKTFDIFFFQPLGFAHSRQFEGKGALSALTLYWQYMLATLHILCIGVLYFLVPASV